MTNVTNGLIGNHEWSAAQKQQQADAARAEAERLQAEADRHRASADRLRNADS